MTYGQSTANGPCIYLLRWEREQGSKLSGVACNAFFARSFTIPSIGYYYVAIFRLYDTFYRANNIAMPCQWRMWSMWCVCMCEGLEYTILNRNYNEYFRCDRQWFFCWRNMLGQEMCLVTQPQSPLHVWTNIFNSRQLSSVGFFEHFDHVSNIETKAKSYKWCKVTANERTRTGNVFGLGSSF